MTPQEVKSLGLYLPGAEKLESAKIRLSFVNIDEVIKRTKPDLAFNFDFNMTLLQKYQPFAKIASSNTQNRRITVQSGIIDYLIESCNFIIAENDLFFWNAEPNTLATIHAITTVLQRVIVISGNKPVNDRFLKLLLKTKHFTEFVCWREFDKKMKAYQAPLLTLDAIINHFPWEEEKWFIPCLLTIEENFLEQREAGYYREVANRVVEMI